MLRSCDLVAFVPTTDLARARGFYEQMLGLPLESQSPEACVFRANGTMLRVTAVEHVAPASYTVLGWAVPDIAAAIRELGERGVAMLRYEGIDQDALGVWLTPSGARVAWFQDPDGNTLSLTQF